MVMTLLLPQHSTLKACLTNNSGKQVVCTGAQGGHLDTRGPPDTCQYSFSTVDSLVGLYSFCILICMPLHVPVDAKVPISDTHHHCYNAEDMCTVAHNCALLQPGTMT